MKKVFSLVLSLLAATTMAFAVQETVECGKQVTLTATPATGYEFVEWQVDGARVSTANPWYNVDASTTTYTAIFAPQQYDITYKDQGGSAFSGTHGANYPTKHTYGTATSLVSPSKTGYTFMGWFTTSACTGYSVASIGATDKTADFDLFAKWIINQYIISFNSNGGSEVDEIKQDYGTVVTAPANPTKTGYTFGGWTPNVPATMPASDMECVASWSATEYTIGYTLNGGSVATANPTAYTIESTAITLNNPTRAGYTFAGWTGTGLSEATTTVTIAHGSTGDRTYTATWTPIEYNISYDLTGGSVATANPSTYTIESGAITLTNPTREGYDFAGWTGTVLSEATASVTIAAGSTGDKSYTATWTLKKYTINFYINGNLAQTLQVDHGTTPTYTGTTEKTKPQDDGCDYTFDSWYPNLYAADKDENYEAVFTCAPRSYTIAFMNHDGTVTLQSTSVEYGQTPEYNGATPTKPDADGKTFTFQAWRREGATVDGIVPVDGPAIYHPQFTSENATYTVTVASDNTTMGTVSGGGSGIVGTSVTITATANQCYEFVRWSDNNTEYTRTFTISGDATYTAYFKKTEYTVTANPDNATRGSVSITIQQ